MTATMWPPRPARATGATRPRPVWQWALVAAWCAVAAWYAFGLERRVPLLGWVDLGFHELGHLVMYLVPVSQVLTAAMGSILQCAVPAGLAVYFWVWRRDLPAAAVCLAWASTSLQDASVYIADAPFERLELIGGEHDWAYVLGPEGFDRLGDAAAIADAVRRAGVLVWLVAIGLCAFGMWRAEPLRLEPRPASRRPVRPPTGTPDLLPRREHAHRDE